MSTLPDLRWGFLGCGKMATALVRGAVAAGVLSPARLRLHDVVPAAVEALVASVGGMPEGTNVGVCTGSDVVVLCVKPGDAPAVLREVQAALAGKLLVSIAAGVSLATLAEAAGPGVRLVRVMPNTPALIGQGAAAFALGPSATLTDATAVVSLFGAVGTVTRVHEASLDAVTGLSGSGPAFVCLMIEALADGGVLCGLPRPLALELAAQTVAGTAAMVRQTGEHPALLRDAVASPGGTTIAGLAALEESGVRGALIAAVRAATARSRELGAG